MEFKERAQPTEPGPVIQEIRTRMDKMDRVDEIVSAIDAMRNAVGCSSCSIGATHGRSPITSAVKALGFLNVWLAQLPALVPIRGSAAAR